MNRENKKIDELIKIRKEKLQKLKDSGIDPYPHNYNPNSSVELILKEEMKLIASNNVVSVAGRIVSIRQMGKALFINIQGEYDRLQCYISNKNMDIKEESYMTLINNIDIGDIVGLEGKMFYTKTNEYTLRSHDFILLSKSIRPLPNLKEKEGESFNSFNDKELRYRNRHLDLIVNPSVKDVFIIRSKIINEIRKFLNNRNYLEVETPILQPLYGGANARPFTTFHNTLDEKLYMRIAVELYLKRLIIGGFNKVYELSKNFRNEGMDKDHNPEFTMLEFYAAYSDVYKMMECTEAMIKTIFKKVKNPTSHKIEINFGKNKISLKNKFKVIDFFESIKTFSKKDLSNMDSKALRKFLKDSKIKIEKDANYGNMIDKIFSHFVEPNLIQPTFIVNFPKEISPFAKTHRENNNLVERFELFIGGMEIANAFTELNDPIDQRIRFENQEKLKNKGDHEAQVLDEDFLQAMEVGMPPTGGVGMGIDRIIMIITGQLSIKDVLLFPAMRQIDS